MEDILKFLDNLPDLGKIETVKSGMFGKEQSKYICPNGHKNDSNETYCTNSTCGLNIKGLTKKQIDERLQDIIDFSELGSYIDNPVRTYSSGMYMRLAFAVAINILPASLSFFLQLYFYHNGSFSTYPSFSE